MFWVNYIGIKKNYICREEAAGWSEGGTAGNAAWAGGKPVQWGLCASHPLDREPDHGQSRLPTASVWCWGAWRERWERSPAVTGGGGAACMGIVRCWDPPAAGTGLSPSLGCWALPCNLLPWDLVTLAPFCILALLPPPPSLWFYFRLYLILA